MLREGGDTGEEGHRVGGVGQEVLVRERSGCDTRRKRKPSLIGLFEVSKGVMLTARHASRRFILNSEEVALVVVGNLSECESTSTAIDEVREEGLDSVGDGDVGDHAAGARAHADGPPEAEVRSALGGDDELVEDGFHGIEPKVEVLNVAEGPGFRAQQFPVDGGLGEADPAMPPVAVVERLEESICGAWVQIDRALAEPVSFADGAGEAEARTLVCEWRNRRRRG